MKRLSDKDLIEAYMSAKKLLDIDPLFIKQLETELKRRSISIENKQTNNR
ncbi:sporulation histidine kinase inhibitor Sda [Bacillus subtilis]